MMAAGRAAENNAKVLILEKSIRLGIKLTATGKGRCNITNAEFDTKNLVEKFGKQGRFLFSALSKFGNRDVINFFESRGLGTKVEKESRVFPESNSSLDVLTVLEEYLKQSHVEIRTDTPVESIEMEDDLIDKIVLRNGEELKANKYLVATGGKSYPSTGSSGDGYKWLEKMGHTIVEPNPALSPVFVKESLVQDLEGLSLKDVTISIYQNSKKIDSRSGEALFTHNGMSGPIILAMSKNIGFALKKGAVKLEIDFMPELEFKILDKQVQADFAEGSNKLFRNSLGSLLPKKMVPIIIELSKIDPDKKVNSITKEERKRLIHLLKNFELTVKSLHGFSKAIVTTGGVSLKEVDPKTMQSKFVKNLYLAGEVLDLDGPTGGYNLQSCWSTGFAAGSDI